MGTNSLYVAPEKEAVAPVLGKSPEQGPAMFVGGGYCGELQIVPLHRQLSLPSAKLRGRFHVYEDSGKLARTDPPARIYEHIQIIDARNLS